MAKDTYGDGFSDGIEMAQGTNPNDPASVPENFALMGTGILGTKESFESTTEVPVFNAGIAANINDGNLNSRVDTFNGANPGTVSFVGILWPRLITEHPILSLELTMATFRDGGWFGPTILAQPAGQPWTPRTWPSPSFRSRPTEASPGRRWTPPPIT